MFNKIRKVERYIFKNVLVGLHFSPSLPRASAVSLRSRLDFRIGVRLAGLSGWTRKEVAVLLSLSNVCEFLYFPMERFLFDLY